MSEVVPDTRPTISVVLIVLNGAPWIGRQLEALAGQRFGAGSWEVIVADNGSTDGTQELVEARAATFPVPLHLVDASARPGVSYARNVGASAARAPAMAFCDCDDVVHDDWVAQAALALEESVCVTGRIRELAEPHDPDSEILNPEGLAGRGIHGCNFAVRRHVFFEVGGFDESLPPYGCDDSEFSLRLLDRGHAIVAAPDMVLYFRRTVGLRPALRKVYLSGIAETVVWKRHPQLFDARLGMRNVLVELASWPMSAARGLVNGDSTTKGLARSAVTTWAHVVGHLTWIRTGRAGRARLVFDPYDVG